MKNNLEIFRPLLQKKEFELTEGNPLIIIAICNQKNLDEICRKIRKIGRS